MLGSTILTGGAGLFSNFSPNYVSLLILRCFVGVGIGVGGTTVFCPWFLEFAPVSNRGKRMVLLSTFWTVGTIFEAALAWIVMPRLGWRWLLALSSLPSIAMLLLYSLVPESPTYLCMKELSREQSKSGSSTVLRSENLQDDSLYVDVFILVWQRFLGLFYQQLLWIQLDAGSRYHSCLPQVVFSSPLCFTINLQL